jgi:hypothetical protein
VQLWRNAEAIHYAALGSNAVASGFHVALVTVIEVEGLAMRVTIGTLCMDGVLSRGVTARKEGKALSNIVLNGSFAFFS